MDIFDFAIEKHLWKTDQHDRRLERLEGDWYRSVFARRNGTVLHGAGGEETPGEAGGRSIFQANPIIRTRP